MAGEWRKISESRIRHFNGNEVVKMNNGYYRALRRLANGFDPLGDYPDPADAKAAAARTENGDTANNG